MGAAALAIHEGTVALHPWDVNDETKLTSRPLPARECALFLSTVALTQAPHVPLRVRDSWLASACSPGSHVFQLAVWHRASGPWLVRTFSERHHRESQSRILADRAHFSLCRGYNVESVTVLGWVQSKLFGDSSCVGAPQPCRNLEMQEARQHARGGVVVADGATLPQKEALSLTVVVL